MNRAIIVLIPLLFTINSHAQQTKKIYGRVLSEDLELLVKAKVYNSDTAILGATDSEGYFEIETPDNTERMIFGFVGMEWTSVKLTPTCNYVEVIVMSDVIYDFESNKKERRLRYRRFKQMPKKHLEAYEKGLFKSEEPCICYVFRE